ncbi:MAG: BrnT family toxin [Alphaproteobacteria bacterium]|nr:BrnT family toxin [Alphaproteobacteria bacterium]MBM3952807.1 BrnT family toxin [Rhodospirillales bacterium]
MRIAFDARKDAINRGKHGVSLAFGAAVLADPDRADALDLRMSHVEKRTITYGRVQNRVWVCVYAERDGSHRIISVRKANERETKRYWQKKAPR